KQPAEPLVEVLCEILKVHGHSSGVQALDVLGEIGPAAAPALPVLRKLLDEPGMEPAGNYWGPPHRAAVIRATGKIGPAAAVGIPGLLSLLNEDNYYIRSEVDLAMANMGPAGKQALANRDAAWAATMTLLAAPPATIAAPLLVQIHRRLWIPHDKVTL